ncbi:hypothetical protein GOODEAATRI_033149, partial [Goodea atripinnis]
STWWKSLNLLEKKVPMCPAERTSQTFISDDSNSVLHDVRVDLSHSIHVVRSHHAQVSHADSIWVSLLNQRHPAQMSVSPGNMVAICRGTQVQVSLIDLVDDRQMASQQLTEHVDWSPDPSYTQTLSHSSFLMSTRILISSGMARAGWVSFSWIATWWDGYVKIPPDTNSYPEFLTFPPSQEMCQRSKLDPCSQTWRT